MLSSGTTSWSLAVISVGEQGYWEGRVGQHEGWFPSSCVAEVKRKSGWYDNDSCNVATSFPSLDLTHNVSKNLFAILFE